MSGYKDKMSVLTHTPTPGQEDNGYCWKIVLLNFLKFGVDFQLIEI